MVAANKNLLKEVRRLAIKEELLAMKLMGRVVVPVVPQKVVGKKGSQAVNRVQHRRMRCPSTVGTSAFPPGDRVDCLQSRGAWRTFSTGS